MIVLLGTHTHTHIHTGMEEDEAIDDVSALRISAAVEEHQRAAKCFDAALEARLGGRVEAQSLQAAETELLRSHHALEDIAAPPPEQWRERAEGFNDDIDAHVFNAKTNRLFMRASRELKLYEGELANPLQTWDAAASYPSDHPLKAIRWWTSHTDTTYRPYPITGGSKMTRQNRSALFDVFWKPGIELDQYTFGRVEQREMVVGRGSVIIHAIEEPPPMGYPTNQADFNFHADYREQVEYWFTACGLNDTDKMVRGPLRTPPMHVFFNYDKFARKTDMLNGESNPKEAMFTREKPGRSNLLEGRDLANAPAGQKIKAAYSPAEVASAVRQAGDLKSYFFTRYFLRPWVHTARMMDAEQRAVVGKASIERWGTTGGIYTGMSPSWQYEQKTKASQNTALGKQTYMKMRGIGSTLEHIIPQGAARDAMMHQNDAIGQGYVPNRFDPKLPPSIDPEIVDRTINAPGLDKKGNWFVPKDRRFGFDKFVGFNRGHSYLDGIFFRDTDQPYRCQRYEPDYQTDHFLDFLDEAQDDPDKPFLGYISFLLLSLSDLQSAQVSSPSSQLP